MSAAYDAFLRSKERTPERFGREPGPLHASLFPFQRLVTEWAIRRGRAAEFLDTGLGKTRCQLEWLRQSVDGVRPGLILAPLAVASQTIAEAGRLGLEVVQVNEPSAAAPLQITNYEKLHRFVGANYSALCLDEASILKSLDGKTRTMLIKEFTGIPRRLCCTATPAPNDLIELANYAEFLGIMPVQEVKATFFVHDSESTAARGWRLKGHAQDVFWRWLAKWAVYMRRPSDLGFDDNGFALPPLNIRDESVAADWRPEGMLFAAGLGGIGDRREARRATLDERVARAAAIISDSADQWLVWCGLNEEGNRLEAALGAACVQIAGADDDDDKLARELRWRTGEARVLITKPSIFGFGMNWQHCHRMLFLGLGDSYESYYQAIRRCWRYGQKSPVDVVIVSSDAESEVAANVRRKEADHAATSEAVVAHTKEVMMDELRGNESGRPGYVFGGANGDSWSMMLGDCVERIREVASDSIGLSIFSPPFSSLFTYSASDRDMGNVRDDEEFFRHFDFLIPELRRVSMPGRTVVVHCQDIITTKTIHGYIGKRDFSGDIVRAFLRHGWIYDGRITVDKDPQAAAIRSKSKQLLFVQKERDSGWLMSCLPDYLLRFRDPRDNDVPVKGDVTNEEWILWARPIWYGIRESETLNAAEARTEKDEKHVAPLQLETIERCVRLWTNKGETIFSPFAGIGSEGYVALQQERKFKGIELKEAYFKQACLNLERARKQLGLF